MSISAYEEQLARLDMYTKIMEGMAQADRGELVDGETALLELKKKYADRNGI